MDLDQDHGAIAWSNWTAQFEDSAALKAVVISLIQPLNTIQTVLKQLLDDRWLTTAVGAQLDGVGDILGRPRRISNTKAVWHFGFDGQTYTGGFETYKFYKSGSSLFTGGKLLDDDDYRLLLQWKIIVDSSYGTAPQIEAALKILFAVDRIAVEDLGNAHIRVHIGRQPTDNDSFLGNPVQWIAKAAGVAVSFKTYDTGEDFDFSPGSGIYRLVSEEGDPLLDENGFALYGIE